MNLSDVKIRVKRKFGDEAQVQINDSDIIRWVNDAQYYIVNQNETVLQKVGTADIVANQQEYTLPSDLLILRTISMRVDSTNIYYPLMGLTFQQFDSMLGGWDGNLLNKGVVGYYHVYGNLLKVYPIPSVGVSAGIKIYYSRIPTNIQNDQDVIDLPLTYHNAVVNYCLQQAYEQDDSSWDAAKYKNDQVTFDINQNKGRENSNPTSTYPVITIMPEDM